MAFSYSSNSIQLPTVKLLYSDSSKTLHFYGKMTIDSLNFYPRVYDLTTTGPNATDSVTVNNLVFNNDSLEVIKIKRPTGNRMKVLKDVCADYLDLQNFELHGNASYFAGANSIDRGGNVGWSFTECSELVSISGTVQTENGIPIPGVVLTLSGDETQTDTTEADGLYNFNVAQGGNFSVAPSKVNDSITNNGITTTDIALIRRHVLGSTLLNSPYKIIAADATNNSQITTGDIPLVRIVVLNDKAKFPPGNSRLWEFVSSYNSATNPFPFEKTRTYTNITSNQINQDFIGVKIGDVNNSWNAGNP